MQFEDLVKKTLSDPDFRKAVAQDPEAALRAHGVEPTAEQVAALKGVDGSSLARVHAAFSSGPGIDCGH